MGEDQLLQLANTVLQTDIGKKLLGETINISEIQGRISTLTSTYDIDLEALSETTLQEQTEILTQTNKTNQTLSARERINAKENQFSTDSKSLISKAKQELIGLKAKLRSEIPILETYTINGRLFDKNTGEVLDGAKVQLGVNNAALETSNIPLPVDSKLISNIPNFNFNDMVYIPIPGNSTRTDKQGNFSIKIKVPIIPKNQKTPLNLGLLYSRSGFLPSSSPIINGDKTIKSDLSASSLINIDKSAEKISQTFNDGIDKAQVLVKSLALKPWDLIISAKKLSIAKVVDTIKTKLIPLVIGMLIAFGISKLTESNRKTCPTRGELNSIVRRRNRTVRQLNQIYMAIAANTALALAFNALSKTFKGVRLSLDSLPAPQAIGIFPAKDFGGLIFAQPYSFTAKLQHINDELEKLEEKYDSVSRSQLVSLVFLVAGATTVVLLLQGIDKLAQECAQEGGVAELELTVINQELLDLAEEQEEDGNPIIKNTNGFVLSVETDNSNPVGTLKRRFAVGKDTRGITLIKGEPSFSSNDQILIDELVFYIQQNDLKAY
tara:strand:- start:17342 stop:18994 length:1653 start_codon:yes stop_codon:yes gene_type:complete